MPVYLDANATEPLRPEAREAVLAAMDMLGNPSAVHGAGRAARRLLEEARESLLRRFGAAELVFTSGGTEANALAVAGLSALPQGIRVAEAQGQRRRLLAGATEHDAIRRGTPISASIPVQPDGQVNLAALEALLAEGPPALVALMAANNETGVLHPLPAVAALCRAHGALLHVDAVQAAGRIPLSLAELGADSMAISGHKLGGPMGAGALLLRAGLDLAPLIAGGGQERGRRGGTEALPAIAGMAAAALACHPEDAARLATLRDGLEARLRAAAPDLLIAGAEAPRLPTTTNLILPGVPAETQVIALDLAGFRVSAGSACSSGKVTASHVLAAMGLGEAAGCGIRISLPWNTKPEDVSAFGDAWLALRSRLSRHAA